jgi:hypothetical protein
VCLRGAHLRRPKRCSHTIVSFLRLFASGTYVNTANSRTELKIKMKTLGLQGKGVNANRELVVVYSFILKCFYLSLFN